MSFITAYPALIIIVALMLSYLAFLIYTFLKPKVTSILSDFEETFIDNEYKFLVFEPQFNSAFKNYNYDYFDLKGYDEWNFDKFDMQRRLHTIGGLCQECRKGKALVGYYNTGYMKSFPDHNQWIIPQQESEVLCKECTFTKIKPILEKYYYTVHKLLTRPCGGDGIYITFTEI